MSGPATGQCAEFSHAATDGDKLRPPENQTFPDGVSAKPAVPPDMAGFSFDVAQGTSSFCAYAQSA
jgi:hypothetical protein